MFKLSFKEYFLKKYAKLCRKNPLLKNQIDNTLQLLAENPTNTRLTSHKVQSTIIGKAMSSRVNGDLRIIWNYDSNDIEIIDIFDIGGTFGKW